MNAKILLRQFNNDGVILQVDGDRLRLDAPKGYLTPERLATIRQFKGQLLASLARHTPSRQSLVWDVVVDGKRVTVIDPDRLSQAQMTVVACNKFGPQRVTGVQMR